MNSLNLLVNYLKTIKCYLQMEVYLFYFDAVSLSSNVVHLTFRAQKSHSFLLEIFQFSIRVSQNFIKDCLILS